MSEENMSLGTSELDLVSFLLALAVCKTRIGLEP